MKNLEFDKFGKNISRFLMNNPENRANEIEAAVEAQKEIGDTEVNGVKIEDFLTAAEDHLSAESFQKLQFSVLSSLKNSVSVDFPLMTLGKFDTDAESGIDSAEFSEYLDYLEQMLSGIMKMSDLHENYATPTKKRRAYELLTKYDTEEPKAVTELIKNGVELSKIDARIKLWKTLSPENIGKLNDHLQGSWYQRSASGRRKAIDKLEEIKGKLFEENYNGQHQFYCTFEKWDGIGDPNYNLSEEEFLQRILVYNISGSEISQAFSDTPSLSDQKSAVQAEIRNTPAGASPAAAKIEQVTRIEQAERLTVFLDSLEKWDGMDKEGFAMLGRARDNLRKAGKDANAFNTALDDVSTVLKEYADYYESNDNVWDWGWTTDVLLEASGTVGAIQVAQKKARREAGIGDMGQQNAEWIVQSDGNLATALRAVKATDEAAGVMRQEMQHVRVVQAKKENGTTLTKEESKLLQDHKSEIPTIKTIQENSEKYKNSSEGKRLAANKYEHLLRALRGTGDLPPEYLQLLSAGRENVIEGIASKLAFQKATDDYISENGTDDLQGSSLLDEYNDMKGLEGAFNWSDESVDMMRDIAQMVAVIIITEIATMGMASAFAFAEGAALGAEGVALVETGVTAVRGVKTGEAILEAVENGNFVVRNGARVMKLGVKGLNKVGTIGKNIQKGLEISKEAKWGTRILKGTGQVGMEAFTGAVKFTAVDYAMFGVKSSDELFSKFGQNMEMFALFGGAGKLSGAAISKLGSLAEATGTAAFLARQGIELSSEFGVFATFQAAENALKYGNLDGFNWKELGQMMVFSASMRFVHGFPRLAKKLGEGGVGGKNGEAPKNNSTEIKAANKSIEAPKSKGVKKSETNTSKTLENANNDLIKLQNEREALQKTRKNTKSVEERARIDKEIENMDSHIQKMEQNIQQKNIDIQNEKMKVHEKINQKQEIQTERNQAQEKINKLESENITIEKQMASHEKTLKDMEDAGSSIKERNGFDAEYNRVKTEYNNLKQKHTQNTTEIGHQSNIIGESNLKLKELNSTTKPSNTEPVVTEPKEVTNTQKEELSKTQQRIDGKNDIVISESSKPIKKSKFIEGAEGSVPPMEGKKFFINEVPTPKKTQLRAERRTLRETRNKKLNELESQKDAQNTALKNAEQKLKEAENKLKNTEQPVLDPMSSAKIKNWETQKAAVDAKLQSHESTPEQFDAKMMGEGVGVDGVTWKLECHLEGKHYTWKLMQGEKVFKSARSKDSKTLPDNHKGNKIREKYNEIRNDWMKKQTEAKMEMEIQQAELAERISGERRFMEKSKSADNSYRQVEAEVARAKETAKKAKEAAAKTKSEIKEVQQKDPRIKEINKEIRDINKEAVKNALLKIPSSIKTFFEGMKKNLKGMKPKKAAETVADAMTKNPQIGKGFTPSQIKKMAAILVLGLLIPSATKNSSAQGEVAPSGDDLGGLDVSEDDLEEIDALMATIEQPEEKYVREESNIKPLPMKEITEIPKTTNTPDQIELPKDWDKRMEESEKAVKDSQQRIQKEEDEKARLKEVARQQQQNNPEKILNQTTAAEMILKMQDADDATPWEEYKNSEEFKSSTQTEKKLDDESHCVMWTTKNGEKYVMIENAGATRRKAKAGNVKKGFLNREGGVKKDDVIDAIKDELPELRRRSLKREVNLHSKIENEDRDHKFMRIYRVEK